LSFNNNLFCRGILNVVYQDCVSHVVRYA
jgi:hypothetical protein